MILVDENLLEYRPILKHFQTKQDMLHKRPTGQSVKSTINHQIKSTLDDPTLPEDVEAKQYAQNRSRYLHTKHINRTRNFDTTREARDICRYAVTRNAAKKEKEDRTPCCKTTQKNP